MSVLFLYPVGMSHYFFHYQNTYLFTWRRQMMVNNGKNVDSIFRMPRWVVVLSIILGLGVIAIGVVGPLTQVVETRFLVSANTDQFNSKPITTSASPTEAAVEAGTIPPIVSDIGALITRVVPDSPADQAGLQEGDVILAVDGQLLDHDNNLADLIATYKPGDRVSLTVERSNGVPRDVAVELGQYVEEPEEVYLGVGYRSSTLAKVSKEDPNSASKVINLVSREITLEELTKVAPFTILWPQDVPEGYQLSRILEMSESWTESSGAGVFILEYINTNNQDKSIPDQGILHIWQYLKTTQSLPSLSGKHVIGSLRLADGTEISLYEGEDESKRAFLERGEVNIELWFQNMPVEDVERIVSSLVAN
jgi:hypothetical protein